MSLTTDAVSMYGHGRKLKTWPNTTRYFMGLLKFDKAPALSNMVKPEHRANRDKVTEGVITSWGEHGRVAIVTDEDGVSAAFYNDEVEYPHCSQKSTGDVASVLVSIFKD